MKRKNLLESANLQRREFFKKSMFLGTLPAVGLLTMCREKTAEEITPTEDLMREHGLLSRVLLIYDSCRLLLIDKKPVNLEVLQRSASVIREFIQDYHERQEEESVFPRFEMKGKMSDLVKILRSQHLAGRTITDRISEFGKIKERVINDDQRQNLINLLDVFNRMYRPHAAREDTVLFPLLREVVSAREFNEMGEMFEDREHEQLGEDGFAKMVEKVSGIEKLIAIDDLAQFTPKI